VDFSELNQLIAGFVASRVAQLDDEGAALDARLSDLQAISRSILEL